jgi:hypothetical protein
MLQDEEHAVEQTVSEGRCVHSALNALAELGEDRLDEDLVPRVDLQDVLNQYLSKNADGLVIFGV